MTRKKGDAKTERVPRGTLPILEQFLSSPHPQPFFLDCPLGGLGFRNRRELTEDNSPSPPLSSEGRNGEFLPGKGKQEDLGTLGQWQRRLQKLLVPLLLEWRTLRHTQ